MDAQQRLLDHVLGFGDAAEHPVGDRERRRPHLLELVFFGGHVGCAPVSSSASRSGLQPIRQDNRPRCDTPSRPAAGRDPDEPTDQATRLRGARPPRAATVSEMQPPPVKVCGVARLDDAVLAAELGAWAVGMVFYRAFAPVLLAWPRPTRSPPPCGAGPARRRLRQLLARGGRSPLASDSASPWSSSTATRARRSAPRSPAAPAPA